MEKEYNKYFKANKANWDNRVKIHLSSKEFYDIEAFKKGKLSFSAKENEEIGEVRDKKLLHLMCHMGMDTMSFSRLGAKATGVDFSKEALSVANKLKEELGLDTRFIESNIYDLPKVLDEKFDIVFTSVGVLTWLPNLTKWAEVIFNLLRPGGLFYIKESHPFSLIFGYRIDSYENFRPIHKYFEFGKSNRYEEPYTYAHDGTDELIKAKENYQFEYRLSDIINALISSGLQIEKILESPIGFFQQLPFMKKNEKGVWLLPEDLNGLIPLTFSIFARKPRN